MDSTKGQVAGACFCVGDARGGVCVICGYVVYVNVKENQTWGISHLHLQVSISISRSPSSIFQTSNFANKNNTHSAFRFVF